MNHLRQILAVMCSLSFATAGCGKTQPWEQVVPAKGTVTFKGKPIAGVQLTLFPVNPEFPASVRPTATTSQNGEFQIGTHSATDGAPAGEYKVAVVWHPLVNNGGGPVRGDNALPQKLANPETSDLKIVIAESETTIPNISL